MLPGGFIVLLSVLILIIVQHAYSATTSNPIRFAATQDLIKRTKNTKRTDSVGKVNIDMKSINQITNSKSKLKTLKAKADKNVQSKLIKNSTTKYKNKSLEINPISNDKKTKNIVSLEVYEQVPQILLLTPNKPLLEKDSIQSKGNSVQDGPIDGFRINSSAISPIISSRIAASNWIKYQQQVQFYQQQQQQQQQLQLQQNQQNQVNAQYQNYLYQLWLQQRQQPVKPQNQSHPLQLTQTQQQSIQQLSQTQQHNNIAQQTLSFSQQLQNQYEQEKYRQNQQRNSLLSNSQQVIAAATSSSQLQNGQQLQQQQQQQHQLNGGGQVAQPQHRPIISSAFQPQSSQQVSNSPVISSSPLNQPPQVGQPQGPQLNALTTINQSVQTLTHTNTTQQQNARPVIPTANSTQTPTHTQLSQRAHSGLTNIQTLQARY